MAFKLFSKKKSPKKGHIKHIMSKKKANKTEKKVSHKEVRKIEKIPDKQAYDILRKYKIPLADSYFVKNEKELQLPLKKLGFPVVMKVSGNIMHKTEVGGIRKDIRNFEDALKAFRDLIKINRVDSVLVQRQLSGIELIVGSKRDSQFGHVIVTGLGGVFVETLKDVSFRVCPISTQDAEEMVKELKGYEILKGVRGANSINFHSLYETLTKVSRLAISEKIKELDINPLFCNEKECIAADVRIVK